MTRTVALVAGAIVAVFLATMAWLSFRDPGTEQFAQCRGSAVAGDIGGPFTLTDASGATVTDKEVLTGPSLIYFGYTFCPDVCPMDVDRNAHAVEILEEAGREVTPVFITVDPERDTPQVVGEFAEAMHPRMVGLTGTEAQIKEAASAYRAYYRLHPPVDGEYLVDHSTFSYLVLPGHGFVDYFRRETTPQEMAEKIGCFLDQL